MVMVEHIALRVKLLLENLVGAKLWGSGGTGDFPWRVPDAGHVERGSSGSVGFVQPRIEGAGPLTIQFRFVAGYQRMFRGRVVNVWYWPPCRYCRTDAVTYAQWYQPKIRSRCASPYNVTHRPPGGPYVPPWLVDEGRAYAAHADSM